MSNAFVHSWLFLKATRLWNSLHMSVKSLGPIPFFVPKWLF